MSMKLSNTLVYLLESWATTENPMNSTEDILAWVREKNQSTKVSIRKVPYAYDDLSSWHYNGRTGEIQNADHSFFQITGIVEREQESVVRQQPIILQKEIGYLGILGKVIDDTLYFLMQAKIEPGNVNKIQISPTIQATKSNFMQSHGGKVPSYLEYFANKDENEIVVDQIQSEQSSRFLGKRNRNMIIITEDDVEVLDSHRWMTLGQIKELMAYDNLVNMDTRTVISCIPFSLKDFSYKELSLVRSLYRDESLFNSMFFGDGSRINDIYHYLNELKMFNRSSMELVDLKSLEGWHFDEGEIKSENASFKVIYCDIEIEGREIQQWKQPLLEATGSSIFGLASRIKNGKTEFLVRAKTEIGCFDVVELGPTIQIDPKEDADASPVDKLFLSIMEEQPSKIAFNGMLSEEGGRFYQEQNRNVLLRVEEGDFPEDLPPGYFWADYYVLNILIQFNNCLNIQLRNLLSILKI